MLGMFHYLQTKQQLLQQLFLLPPQKNSENINNEKQLK
jgi:hypothetical protein